MTGQLQAYVAPDLCEELILGYDWLEEMGAAVSFVSPTLWLKGSGIPLSGREL